MLLLDDDPDLDMATIRFHTHCLYTLLQASGLFPHLSAERGCCKDYIGYISVLCCSFMAVCIYISIAIILFCYTRNKNIDHWVSESVSQQWLSEPKTEVKQPMKLVKGLPLKQAPWQKSKKTDQKCLLCLLWTSSVRNLLLYRLFFFSCLPSSIFLFCLFFPTPPVLVFPCLCVVAFYSSFVFPTSLADEVDDKKIELDVNASTTLQLEVDR